MSRSYARVVMALFRIRGRHKVVVIAVTGQRRLLAWDQPPSVAKESTRREDSSGVRVLHSLSYRTPIAVSSESFSCSNVHYHDAGC